LEGVTAEVSGVEDVAHNLQGGTYAMQFVSSMLVVIPKMAH
jgi:hypothetical protein